jgi:hypothetical protein
MGEPRLNWHRNTDFHRAVVILDHLQGWKAIFAISANAGLAMASVSDEPMPNMLRRAIPVFANTPKRLRREVSLTDCT